MYEYGSCSKVPRDYSFKNEFQIAIVLNSFTTIVYVFVCDKISGGSGGLNYLNVWYLQEVQKEEGGIYKNICSPVLLFKFLVRMTFIKFGMVYF